MQNIYLQDIEKEAKKRKNGKSSSEEFRRKITLVNPVYDMTMDYASKQLKRMLKYLKRGIGRSAVHMLSYSVKFRLVPGGKVYEELLVNFILEMVLLAPLAEKKIELTEEYLMFNDVIQDPNKEFHWRDISNGIIRYINEFYIRRNKDKFTREEMNEAIYFIRESGDRIADAMGGVLMQNISMKDFIDLMDKSKEARDIMLVKYPIPKIIPNPKFIEDLAKAKTKTLKGIIDQYPGTILHTVTEYGSMGQFKELAVLMGNKPDLYGNTIPATSPTNNIKGFEDPLAVFVDASGGRKAEVIKLKVADAGVFERSLTLLTSDLKDVDQNYVCGSKHMLKVHITSIGNLEEYEGRYYLLDKDSPSEPYKIIDSKRDKQNLLGKIIYVKTPITCTHPERNKGKICRGCYSENLSVINERIHLGLNSSYTAADETQQQGLSAKHNLITDTHGIHFELEFDNYFILKGSNITLKPGIESDTKMANTSISLHIPILKRIKNSAYRTRRVPEIILIDNRTNEEITLSTNTESKLYLSPELEEIFDKKSRSEEDIVKISLMDFFIAHGEDVPLFLVEYKNHDIAEPIAELSSLMGTKKMNKFETFVDALEAIKPLFAQAGIIIPSIHLEVILSRMVREEIHNPYVDWTKEDVEYFMLGYKESIMYSDSAVTSVLFENLKKLLKEPKFNLYERTGSSIYDQIIKS